MRTHRVVWVLSVAMLCGGLGCSAQDTPHNATLEEPWAPSVNDWDPTCQTGCEELMDYNDPHMGNLTLLVNPEVDDALAQWGACFGTFYACWQEDRPLTECVAQAQCPQVCIDEFDRRVQLVSTPIGEFLAYESVFVNDEAPCGPPAVEVTP